MGNNRHEFTFVNTQYLYPIYSLPSFIVTVDRTVSIISEFKEKNDFDAIVFSGYSGSALAFCLSYLLRVPIVCVRKENESSHCSLICEGICPKKYIIVDDFIDQGKTIKRIKKEINNEYLARFTNVLSKTELKNNKPKLLSIFLYSDEYKERLTFKGTPIIHTG